LFYERVREEFVEEGRDVPPNILKKIQPYVEEPTNFRPAKVGRVSSTPKSLSIGVTVLYQFELASQQVEPKQVAEAKSTLKSARDALHAKRDELARIEAALM
jgi:hypothetical protein